MTKYVRFVVSAGVILSALSAAGQLPGKAGSLLSIDRAAAQQSVRESPYEALLALVDKNSVFFAPAPVNALTHLKNRPNIPDVLTWKPAFVGVSKSLEWGFTTGPITFQRIGARKRQGEYLTIWKRDRKGLWKIELRAEVEHHGDKNESQLDFIEPDDAAYVKHRSAARLKQREDIITSNDKLFATVLKSNNEAAYQEFLADDARLLFPWHPPTLGKDAILGFLKKQKIEIITESEKVDRAYSGELAYSYGTAMVTQAGNTVKHNYIRIWQLQSDFQWRVRIEMLFER